MDALDQTQSDYLSAASDLEDTDGEAFTDGEAYTDNEDLEEAFPGHNAPNPSRGPRMAGAALARSSEPASGRRSPPLDSVHREIPPLMHVPEPRAPRRESYSPAHSDAEEEEEELAHRSFTDSDFSALDVIPPTTPSDGPPDFIAPDPSLRYAERPESPQHASLAAIEEKLQQVTREVCHLSGILLKMTTKYNCMVGFFVFSSVLNSLLLQTRSADTQAEPAERKAPQFIV